MITYKMTRCLDCMGSRKIMGRIGGKHKSCPACLGLGKVRAKAVRDDDLDSRLNSGGPRTRMHWREQER